MVLRRSRRCSNYNRGLPFGLEGFLSADILFKLRPEDWVEYRQEKSREKSKRRLLSPSGLKRNELVCLGLWQGSKGGEIRRVSRATL